MEKVEVSTKAEAEKAIKAGKAINIIAGTFALVLTDVHVSIWISGDSAPRIETWGTSAPRIETWGTSAPSIVTRETSAPSIVTRETSAPRIETWGTSAPRIETWGTSAPSIETWGTSAPSIVTRETSAPRIVTRETSAPRIVTRETSAPSIVTWGTSAPSIETRETSAPRIETWGTSAPRIVTRETSAPSIVTWGTSAPSIVTRETSAPSIVTRETSAPRIVTRETSAPSIVTWGTSAPRIVTRGTSAPSIEAFGFSYVFTRGERLKGSATANVLIRIQGKAEIEGGQQFKIKLNTPQDWCDFYGAKVEDGQARVYKAVGKGYVSGWGLTYKPGTMPRDDQWNGLKRECAAGGGLNFSPTPGHTREFMANPEHYLECWVRLDEMVCHFDGSYPQKICAPEVCRPIVEVDRDGNPVAVEAAA